MKVVWCWRKREFGVRGEEQRSEGDGAQRYLSALEEDGRWRRFNGFILKQHMAVHSGKTHKCPKPGCVYSARTASDLNGHFATHSAEKHFACALCPYKGKTKQQLTRHSTIHSGEKKFHCSKCSFSARTVSHLKRHIRLHTGSKPYSCPHCSHKCNNLENLRKHILSTNKHPGKCIYECKFCSNNPFQSNFAREFRTHLVTEHWKMFENTSEATSYIAGIYDVEDDTINFPPDSDGPVEDCRKPKVIVIQKSGTSPVITKDPIVAACSSSKEQNEEATMDGIFPLYIVSKNDTIADTDNLPETWNLIENYDVEESGALVPFTNDSEVLFEEHF